LQNGFLEATPWIHLDIASLTSIEDSRPYVAKGLSGFAVRSILEWVRSYPQSAANWSAV